MIKFTSWLKTNILLLPLILTGTTIAQNQISNGAFDSDLTGWTSIIPHETSTIEHDNSKGNKAHHFLYKLKALVWKQFYTLYNNKET